MRLLQSKKGLSVTNVFSAVFSFLIGMVLLYGLGASINTIIALNTDIFLRMCMVAGWALLVVMMLIYFPIKVLTEPDQKEQTLKA